ncbi:disease resistance protein PIK5-NP-like [Triticum dicoccoides]|uniref:disease resistance protein PIK5-NP-like n=1 Tax=Triticum dicoccoides TaxID=85692 RepID=UPI00188F6300|nr:disease resistance protein PIK5-NP-like [Triticum dicoccoides]
MEGAPVTAATGVLGPVVAKLGALLGSEYKLRRQTRKDIKFIKSKLKPVHAILWAIWGKETLDAQSKELKKEALDLANDMHDAIDDFILTMEPSRRNKHLKIQIKIQASPFQDFRTRVNEVSGRCHSNWKWEKNKSAEPNFSLFSRKNVKSSPPSKLPPPRAPFVHKDASELVGMGKWRDQLIRYLLGEEESTMVQPQLKMSSIVGMAGVGKTTLASVVYKEIGNKFQSRAFVSVTPTPNMKEVLTSILKQVGAEPLAGTEARTEEGLIHTISNFLDDKRYLVIIEDIWHREEWEIISNSFPQNNLGSRIVITTCIASVPGDRFGTNKLCIRINPKPGPLPRFHPDWSKLRWLYGPDGEDVATRMKPDMVGEGFDGDHPIVRMCGGVPLALLCMFSAMTMVRQQQEELGVHVNARDVQDMIEKQVKQNGIQNTPGFEPLAESFQLGYTDLPHHMLKTCLLYCSVYPENYPFHMNDLVMRWVAEGFTYKVDVAKGYFEELCNRGFMLRWEHSLGMPTYQMNPTMRNFLRWKSREDNFITCSSDITPPYACRIHRLCIDDYLVDEGAVEVVDTLLELDWSQIRSLVVFEGAKRYVPFEKLERVRVLDLQYHHHQLEFQRSRWKSFEDFGFEALGSQHVKDICGGLLRVRHLFGLEGTGISEIPTEIARLQHLETLQVRFTWITELPCEIRDLQQLKTLAVSYNCKLAKLPREIGDLQQLETLDLSWTRLTELPREIGNLQNLENLNLQCTELKELPPEVGKLQQLKTLEVGRLGSCITRLGNEIGDLQHLETLDLSWNYGLTQLPREMWKLQNLKRLLLNATGVVKVPREMGGLKKLEILKLDNLEGGALPWEAGQLSKLEGVPECVCQVWKKCGLVSELAGLMLSIRLVNGVTDSGGLIVGTKHMHIPWWIKDHFNDITSLDIRICKLEEEQDLKILREMPNLCELTIRLEVVPRDPIAISGEGFPSLRELVVDSRCVPRFTFQEGAMPRLYKVCFKFKFYGGPPANKGPLGLGIKHLRSLGWVEFRCNEEWYGGAAESSPCMSAMIDVVRKEAQEHPNQMKFDVSGHEEEWFPANKSTHTQVPEATSSGVGEIDKERD